MQFIVYSFFHIPSQTSHNAFCVSQSNPQSLINLWNSKLPNLWNYELIASFPISDFKYLSNGFISFNGKHYLPQ